ncbi:phage major tail protein, TP901-1 family [Bacillus toyonensis]|uniref:phage major tail protein, TP901-1 family n=1 Tax=Bacillus toyonensis TaxID=155322 RepID=UPI000BFB2934|nr:phage major tail protein, TP901-1 family [Bacillus toyonensis]PHG31262.1 phage major tail protein, TP901-1 family [Bacillus toyonensis]
MTEVKNKMYRGDEFIIAAKIKDPTDPTKESLVRPFDQTEDSHSIEADEIEAESKDRTITDYGKISETRSFSCTLSEGDPFYPAAKAAIRGKEYIEIYEINKRTLEAEIGTYMLNSFERSSSTGEFVTYSVESKLSGSVRKETLTIIPPGAGETVTPPSGS